MNQNTHYVLDVTLPDIYSFDSFLVEEKNIWTVERLKSTLLDSEHEETTLVMVQGDRGCGKTHLCHSLLQFSQERQIPITSIDAQHFSKDIPFEQNTYLLPSRNGALLVDNMNAAIGNDVLERALYLLIEEGITSRYPTILFGTQCKAQLGDLQSRFDAALSLQLTPLTDGMLRVLIERRCKSKGLVISDKTISFMLKHLPRDGSSLQRILMLLDKQSLLQKKPEITIYLVKSTLEL